MCVIAHTALCGSGALDFSAPYSKCLDVGAVAHSTAQNQQLLLERVEVKSSSSWSRPCESLISS